MKMKHKPKKLFIDVGPGKLNSEAWKVDKDFFIIGLEPCPNRYNQIRSKYPGVLLNMVASDRNGPIECWWEEKWGVAFYLTEKDKKRDFKRVIKQGIKLDSLGWEEWDEIHIWADIEGAELMMLKGATEMLSSGKVKWINLEVRKAPTVEDWPTAKQVYDFLDKYGFRPSLQLDQLGEKKHRDIVFKK